MEEIFFIGNLMPFFQNNLIFKPAITLKKMFPFPFEEYFKNPKEAISKLKKNYQKLEEANKMIAQSYKTMAEFHEQGAKYYSSLIKQLEFAEKQQEIFMKANPFNFFKELMEKSTEFYKENKDKK